MSVAAFGSQVHSITVSGLPLLHQGFYGNFFGTTVVDLASQPLPPGSYTITVLNTFGTVEIYIPRHVQALNDGVILFGTNDLSDKAENWQRLVRKMEGRAQLPSEPPSFVLESPRPEHPTFIRVNNMGAFGTVDIFRV
jgi:Cell wall-active antibiotics response 4TMS YvqF